MLFFRRRKKEEEPPEIVGPDGLQTMLDLLFDDSMAELASRADRHITRIDAGWRSFRDACASFERVDAEPDLEDLPRSTPESIATMRYNYSKALLEAIADITDAPYGRTVYEKYMSKLGVRERILKQVLQVNYRFRPVMIAYSKRLDAFKSSFSELERGVGEFRRELDGSAAKFNEYSRISAGIGELHACIQDSRSIEASLAEAQAPGKAAAEAAGQEDIGAALERDTERLRDVDSRISEARMRISGFLQPLDRVAKKYDHESQRKGKLRDYISDTARISADYEGFMRLLAGLESAVMEGKLDAKNPGAVADSIDSIRRNDVKAMVDGMGLLMEERMSIAAEAQAHRRQLDSDRSAAEAESERRRRASQLSERLKDAESKKLEAKGRIERSLLDAYGKRVEIALQ